MEPLIRSHLEEGETECYVKERIRKLHPELEVDDTLFNKINDRVWPEYGVCEFMVDRDKQIRKALSKDKR